MCPHGAEAGVLGPVQAQAIGRVKAEAKAQRQSLQSVSAKELRSRLQGLFVVKGASTRGLVTHGEIDAVNPATEVPSLEMADSCRVIINRRSVIGRGGKCFASGRGKSVLVWQAEPSG